MSKALVVIKSMGIGDLVILMANIHAISKSIKEPVVLMAQKNTKAVDILKNDPHVKEIIDLVISSDPSIQDPVVENMGRVELEKSIDNIKKQMEREAKKENFMQAAFLRDELFKFKKILLKKFDD